MAVGIRNGVDFKTHNLQTWKIINRQVFFRGTSCKLAPASVVDGEEASESEFAEWIRIYKIEE